MNNLLLSVKNKVTQRIIDMLPTLIETEYSKELQSSLNHITHSLSTTGIITQPYLHSTVQTSTITPNHSNHL